MAVTANELAVALFDAAVGGYKDTVDAFIYAQGEVSAAEMMLRESGLASNPDNSVFAYLVVAKMTGDTLTEAQKEAAADILVGWLAAGQSRGQVVLAAIDYLMSDAAAADATYGDAAMRFQNKVIAADNYAGNSTDVPTLVAVLAGVTEDPATIGTAAQGDTFVLTTISENVVGTVGNDTIKGIFGDDAAVTHSTTYGAGDSIDGGTGTDTLQLTAVGTDDSAIVEVKNVETISITDLYGATFNATLVEDAPAINFIDTLAGNTSTVNHADLASVIGLSGKGDLTVDYASSTTTATTDAAHISLAGAGTSATVRSTVDVADGNTIDSLSIATSGTNYVDLVAGTAAKTVTVTGNGTNDISIANVGDVAAIMTLDASASTGTNTFSVGSNLNTTDTVKGGTGADTLVAEFALATLVKPTITGVETLKADFDAAATVDLSATTGLTTITLDDSSTAVNIIKAASSVTTLNVTSVDDPAVDNDLTFSYLSTDKGALTLNLGTTASTAANVMLEDVTLSNTSALTINTVGTKDYDINNTLVLNGDQSAINYSATAGAELRMHTAEVDGDVGAVNFTIGEDSALSGGVEAMGNIGDVTMTLAAGASGAAWIYTSGGDNSIGDVTITATGDDASGSMYVEGGDTDVGDITLSADGDAAAVYLYVGTSGGAVGDVTVTADNGAYIHFGISANALSFDDSADEDTDGSIGNVTVTIGDDSAVSGNFMASGGDIGNIDVTVAGENASGNLEITASWLSGDVDDDGSADDYVRGGSIGNITLNITGKDANFDIYALASGGNVGDVEYNVTGEGASGWLGVVAHQEGSGAIGGSIGDVNFTVGDDAQAELGLNFDNDIGAVTVTVGDNASAGMFISGGVSGAALLSDVTVDIGDDSDFLARVSGFGGDVSNFFVTAADADEVDLHFNNVSGGIGNISISATGAVSGAVTFNGNAGDMGDITLEGGAGSYFDVDVNAAGGKDMGTVTIIGGAAADDAVVSLDGGAVVNSVAGINATAWLGSVSIDLSGVTVGTTIQVGAGGSTVLGTAGSDNIFGGAGVDTIELSATSALDEIFSFQKAKDVIDVTDFVTGAETAVADNAAAAAIVANTAYVYADGSNTTTGETIADFEDLADVAAFLSASFDGTETTEHVLAVINNGGTSAYVYDINLADVGVEADEVTLVGVVNADGALTVANVFAS